MFERSLKLSLHIPKRFDAFQVLEWFLLLLEVTCVIFARTTIDVWHAIVGRATKSRKNCRIIFYNYATSTDNLIKKMLLTLAGQ